jgi:hypothetical protein
MVTGVHAPRMHWSINPFVCWGHSQPDSQMARAPEYVRREIQKNCIPHSRSWKLPHRLSFVSKLFVLTAYASKWTSTAVPRIRPSRCHRDERLVHNGGECVHHGPGYGRLHLASPRRCPCRPHSGPGVTVTRCHQSRLRECLSVNERSRETERLKREQRIKGKCRMLRIYAHRYGDEFREFWARSGIRNHIHMFIYYHQLILVGVS